MYGGGELHSHGGSSPGTGRWVGGNGRNGAVDAPERLFCFNHAGGGPAFFRPWCKALAPEIDARPIQLPGRESRFDEPPYRRIDQLLDPLCEALLPYLDRPYALFGHSMGSLVAYEVARRLSDGSGRAPSRLVVSGRRGPRIPTDRRPIHGLPDAEFLAEVARLGGMPREVLNQPDLLEMVLPTLRADYELSETYRPLPGGLLACTLAAYMGTADPEVDRRGLAGWRQETTGGFVLRAFPGDHFYLKGGRPDVLRAIRQDLCGALQPPAVVGDADGLHAVPRPGLSHDR
jgi:medium-chain acyl-[acyl-carrier-protein] hydrolase